MKLVKQSCWGVLLGAALAAILLVAPGCAYYNTFYNTKKFYKEALEEKKRRTGDKPTPAEIQKYDKTIEKASKVLQIHPNSKYVDDALLILGECFYYKQEYLKAQRKFQELITIFPKSHLGSRAQLGLAKTNIELDDFAGAERVLKELQQKEKGEYFYQAQYFLGEIYFRRQQYAEAAKEFEGVIGKLGEAKMRAEAYMRLGACQVILQKFDLAAEAFRRAGENAKPDVNLLFQARLKRASALKKHGRYDEALSLLNGMFKEFSAHRELPLVKLEIAECTLSQGKVEAAVKLYTEIIQNHQRTEASAAAYFALGEIYERRFGDFNKAKESFDNVRRENARSEKVAEAESRSKAISEFLKIKQTIASLLKQIETQAGESVAPVVANDKPKEPSRASTRRAISRIPDRRARQAATTGASGTGTVAAATAPTDVQGLRKMAAELARNKILLAELFLFHFDRPDSAMREYLDVFEFFPQTEYAPQAMYSLAYILSKSPAAVAMHDSVMRVLADQYGDTPQGQAAKRRLGVADSSAVSRRSSNLFYQAEDFLFSQKDPQRALRLYEQFWQSQPNSKLAPQSLYAMGWIYEHALYDNQRALVTYQKLLEKYPDSPFAQQLRPRLAALAQGQTPAADSVAPVTAPQVQTETQAVPQLIGDEELTRPPKRTQPQKPITDEDEIEVSMKKTNATDEKANKDKNQPAPPPR
ncbi:MAG: tetratricopeptide repeat protein [candidate division KSB1 bacterium]|nr:tetratricopeptide repeat protein [candidate division KSB1 bacterium]